MRGYVAVCVRGLLMKVPGNGRNVKEVRVLDKVGTASYVGAGATTSVGILSVMEWVAIGGLLLGVGTFVVNLYFKWRHDQREERLLRETLAKENENHDA